MAYQMLGLAMRGAEEQAGSLFSYVAAKFFATVLDHARVCGLLSDEHFSVDGTLIRARGEHEELPTQGWSG